MEFAAVHAEDFVPAVLCQSFDYCRGGNALGCGIQIGSFFERGKIEVSGSGSEQDHCLSHGGLAAGNVFAERDESPLWGE